MARKKIAEVEKISQLIKQARFIVRGGDYNLIGYKCNGLEIKRKHNETVEELRARCRDSVDWQTPDVLHVFVPF